MDAFFELFSPAGRANRSWYFWHIILDDLMLFSLIIAFAVVTGLTGSLLLILPAIAAVLGGVWAGFAITVKRFHDLEMSGWHLLLMAVPLVNLYFGFLLLFKKGTLGANSYGADPLAAPYASGYIEG